jgi:hypothetical protein
MTTKMNFLLIFIILKDKKSKRSHKNVGMKFFLTIFAILKKEPELDPDPYLVLMDLDLVPGDPKT